MAMRKFYYEYDEVDRTWDVYELVRYRISSDGGREQGAFNALMFCTATEQDAIDAIELLMELQK